MTEAAAVIVGATIAALVSLLTQWMERRRESESFSRENKLRLYNERKQIYIRFVRAAREILDDPPVVRISGDKLDGLRQTIAEMELAGSNESWVAALNFLTEATKILTAKIEASSVPNPPEDWKLDNEEERRDKLRDLMHKASSAFREDLSVK